jgi:hypothetical protein
MNNTLRHFSARESGEPLDVRGLVQAGKFTNSRLHKPRKRRSRHSVVVRRFIDTRWLKSCAPGFVRTNRLSRVFRA